MSHTVGYPPYDRPKPVDADVWIVDAEPIHPADLPLPLRMTVIRLGTGDLLLYSPTRHTPALQRAVEAIGPIRHLVAPGTAHWMFVRDWQRACPGATTWGVPGLRNRRRVRAAGLHVDADLGEAPPPAWAGAIDQVLVRAGPYAEAALFHRASGTLLLADLALNLEGDRLPPLPRLAWDLAGTLAPNGHAPLQLRLLLASNGAAVAEAARRIAAMAPRRVIMAHGKPLEDRVPERLRASLAPLMRGCEAQRVFYGAAAGGAALLIAVGWTVARRRGRRAPPLTARRWA